MIMIRVVDFRLYVFIGFRLGSGFSDSPFLVWMFVQLLQAVGPGPPGPKCDSPGS